MKALVLKHREWDQIFKQIKEDYTHSPATYLLRDRMRRDLGFTYREHQHWASIYDDSANHDWRDDRTQIHIDFYSEQAQTFFMLRYMNRD
jgi:hypothetical protein